MDGDQTLVICGLDLQAKGLLKGGKIVVTVMSNLGLKRLFKRLVCRSMKLKLVIVMFWRNAAKWGGHLGGGEQSGHIIFLRSKHYW